MTKEENLTIYDFINESYKITKPIRLIELFGGIGSQAKALENLGVNFEHYRLIEFDKYPVSSYNAVHGTNYEPKDITKTTAEDLGIVDTKNYEYLLTYSFPCQDLSIAGKQRGMQKGSGTRSGLLWEVERLLDECQELPQVLLMENVPQVIGKKNIDDFQRWQDKLSQLGYKNYVQILNAKDYGIPQNRNRCFMVSLLGNYSYTFPSPKPLKLRLKDMLEDNVAEKYYIKKALNIYATKNYLQYDNSGKGYKSQQNRAYYLNSLSPCLSARNAQGDKSQVYLGETICLNSKVDGKQPSIQNRIYDTNGISTAITTCYMPSIAIKNATKKGYLEAHDGDGIDLTYPNSETRRGRVQEQSMQTITANNNLGVCVNNDNRLRIRKLTPRECWRLMGFSDNDFTKAEKVNSNSQLYKQAGNSIVVPVLEAIFSQLIETKESTVQTTEETKGAGLYDWIKATTREQWEHYLRNLTIDQLLQLQDLEKKIKESEGIKK